MKITILGAGTAVPARGYSPAGLYVQAGREHLLFDAGPGTLQRLHVSGVPWQELDRIFLTHFHLDHCLDLASILFALRLPAPRPPLPPWARQAGIPHVQRRKPLAVYGPPGLKRLYRQLNGAFHGWLSPRGFPLVFKELREAAVKLNGCTVRSRPVNHYDTGAIGYRIEEAGKYAAYSGDTDVCEAVAELGRNAHLLILECSMPDEHKAAGHLTPSECGRIADAANCRHLALTHFYPVFKGYDIRKRVRRAFRGRITLARDFTSFLL